MFCGSCPTFGLQADINFRQISQGVITLDQKKEKEMTTIKSAQLTGQMSGCRASEQTFVPRHLHIRIKA